VRVQLEAYIGAYHKEAEWISSGYLPTFDEYFENGKVSSGHRIATLQPTFMLDIPFPHHVLQEIDFPSKFNDFACSILRLRGDTRCYQVLLNLLCQIKCKNKVFVYHFSMDFRTFFSFKLNDDYDTATVNAGR